MLAKSLQLLAEALVNCRRLEEAVPNFEEAVTVLKRIGDEIPLASALADLANTKQRAGQPGAEAFDADLAFQVSRFIRVILND